MQMNKDFYDILPGASSSGHIGDVWIVPSIRIWGYVLQVEHIPSVITNCGQRQWAIPSRF